MIWNVLIWFTELNNTELKKNTHTHTKREISAIFYKEEKERLNFPFRYLFHFDCNRCMHFIYIKTTKVTISSHMILQ